MQRKVLLEGTNGTRLPKGKRKTFDAVVYGDLVFPDVLTYTKPASDVIHEVVKGLFFDSPALIAANAEQIAIEVAVQQIGMRRLCTIGGTTRSAMAEVLKAIVEKLSLYATSLAISRFRQHDRDLETHPKTEDYIDDWRELHGPEGNPDERDATRAKSFYINRAKNALKQIAKANELRLKHPAALKGAPELKLCRKTNKKDDCAEVDQHMLDTLFPDVK